MDNYNAYNKGIKWVDANQELEGPFLYIRAVGGSVTISSIIFKGGSQTLKKSITLDKNDIIEGPIQSVTKSSGNGILIGVNASNNNDIK